MIGNSSLEGFQFVFLVWGVIAVIGVIVSVLVAIALVYAIRLMSRKIRQQDNEALAARMNLEP